MDNKLLGQTNLVCKSFLVVSCIAAVTMLVPIAAETREPEATKEIETNEEPESGSEQSGGDSTTPAETNSEEDGARREAEKLLEEIDDMFRGESSVATVRMEIRTERWERTLRMRTWSRSTDQSLVRILEPPRERGTATLRVEGDLWNYLPNVDRTVKVPAGMMSASWMGSHFTNDDLVQETRFSDDYDMRVTSRPDEEPEESWIIEMTPKPRAPVVWGKVITEVRAEDRLPTETRFYDERDRLMRTMSFHDIQEMGDRRIPTRIRLTPADKPNEYTEMIYEELSFDVDIPDATFTIEALRR